MTNIELDVARTQVTANRAIVRHFENIDWEQRLFEVAKDIYPTLLGVAYKTNEHVEVTASKCVMAAMVLCEELKKQNYK